MIIIFILKFVFIFVHSCLNYIETSKLITKKNCREYHHPSFSPVSSRNLTPPPPGQTKNINCPAFSQEEETDIIFNLFGFGDYVSLLSEKKETKKKSNLPLILEFACEWWIINWFVLISSWKGPKQGWLRSIFIKSYNI
jgi:hypothetical protein